MTKPATATKPAANTAAAEPAVSTKLIGLNASQVSAVKELLTADEAKKAVVKATTVEFLMSGAEAVKLVVTLQNRAAERTGKKAGNYAALHAVLRKANTAMVAQGKSAKAAEKPADAPAAAKAAKATPAPAKATQTATKAPAKEAAKEAPKEGAKPEQATNERAAKARATRAEAEASGERRTCEMCSEDKAITAFPTTTRNKDGVMGRGKKCRACRDGKTEASKAAAAKAPAAKK